MGARISLIPYDSAEGTGARISQVSYESAEEMDACIPLMPQYCTKGTDATISLMPYNSTEGTHGKWVQKGTWQPLNPMGGTHLEDPLEQIVDP